MLFAFPFLFIIAILMYENITYWVSSNQAFSLCYFIYTSQKTQEEGVVTPLQSKVERQIWSDGESSPKAHGN